MPRGGDAAVVRLTPSQRAIAVSLDGNGRRTSLDPRRGGMSAVCEAARNVACTGARPAAVTNCLNFGNPETSDVGYELAEAIEGMALACEALGLPVVSGNVSLYNEHHGRPIHPRRSSGRRRARRCVACRRRRLPRGGRCRLVAGDGPAAVDGSAYQRVVDGTTEGDPEPDLAASACTSCRRRSRARLLRARTTCPRRGRRRDRRVGHPRSDRRRCARPRRPVHRGRRPAVVRCASSTARSRSWPAMCAAPVGTVGGERIAWPAPRSASPRRRRSTRAPSRGRSASGVRPPDVRRLRHLRPARRPRPRRRAAHLLRPLCAPAPRPGERRIAVSDGSR